MSLVQNYPDTLKRGTSENENPLVNIFKIIFPGHPFPLHPFLSTCYSGWPSAELTPSHRCWKPQTFLYLIMNADFCTRQWFDALIWEQTEFNQADFHTSTLSTVKPIAGLLGRLSPLPHSPCFIFLFYSLPFSLSLSFSSLPFPSLLLTPLAGPLVLVHTVNSVPGNSTQELQL